MGSKQDVRNQNIYKLDGLVPLGRANPFGLQHNRYLGQFSENYKKCFLR